MIQRFASSVVVLSLCVSLEIASGQNQKRFEARSYPARLFHVSHHSYSFGKFTVRIIQAKSIYEESSPPPSSCRAWMDVMDDGQVLRQAYFDDIDPVGSYFGIFLPKLQPLEGYFIALKEGDYDGRLLLVAQDGSLANLPGGDVFLTPDNRYLIGSHDSDYPSLFVIDLARRRVVIDGAKQKLPGVDQWYMDKSGYFFTAVDNTGMPQDSKQKSLAIYRVDLSSLSVTKSAITASRLKLVRKVNLIPWQRTSDCTSAP